LKRTKKIPLYKKLKLILKDRMSGSLEAQDMLRNDRRMG